MSVHVSSIPCAVIAVALLAGPGPTAAVQATPPEAPATQPQLPPASPPTSQPELDDDPRYGLLTPIPDHGAVPPIISMMMDPSDDELDYRARVRDYARQIRIIRRRYLGDMRVQDRREQGIDLLREFTDPAAFKPMIEELEREQDDVRLAMLDIFAEGGDPGQAALAWVAIYDHDPAIRHEALRRMVTPVPDGVIRIVDRALRSNMHAVANAAGALAGALSITQAIPLLIFAQATSDPTPADEGDLAWIATQTQRAYVQDLVPVVGDGSGAFQPVLGIVSEGSVLRVMDAVVVVYRTEIHYALVGMTSSEWGKPTEYLGYDMRAWWEWYNQEYVPFKNEQAELTRLTQPPPDAGGAVP